MFLVYLLRTYFALVVVPFTLFSYAFLYTCFTCFCTLVLVNVFMFLVLLIVFVRFFRVA